MTALMALPLFAQYDGSGFYRVQNQGAAGRYLCIANDRVSERTKKVDFSNGTNVLADIHALATIKKAESNPATILYISGTETGGLTIETQGENTQDLINKIDPNVKLYSSNGELWTKIKKDGYNFVLLLADHFDGNLKSDDISAIIRNVHPNWNNYPEYKKWIFKKIDNSNEYLGIKPNEGVEINGKYYTTFYTDFAYELPEGMKAYYIDNHKYDVTEPIARLMEITGGKVPAKTPVILECSSNIASNNKVMPIKEAVTAIKGNQLSGRYFCYILYQGKTENETDLGIELKNALEFNKNSMRVLGIKDGKLAMVNDNDKALTITTKASGKGMYIPANKAFLRNVNASATKVTLLLPDEYEVAASISKVTADDEQVKTGIYTMTGVKVKEDNNPEGLPSGIYIIDGKKQVIK